MTGRIILPIKTVFNLFNSKTKGNAVNLIYDKSERYDKLDVWPKHSMRLFFWNLKNNPFKIEGVLVSFNCSDIIFKIPDILGVEKWADETKLMAIKAMKEVNPHVEATVTYGEYVRSPGSTFSASGRTTLLEEEALRHIMNDYEESAEKDSVRGTLLRLHGDLLEKGQHDHDRDEDILTVYKPYRPASKRGFMTIEISRSFCLAGVTKKRIATALALSHLLY